MGGPGNAVVEGQEGWGGGRFTEGREPRGEGEEKGVKKELNY